ncbi:MAG: hypothetical protein N3A54_00610 [Patescibacteria group bacterium]|nr:hypothetical protein [Patescibacteria group bacterium]
MKSLKKILGKKTGSVILPTVPCNNIYKKQVVKTISSYVKKMKRRRNPVHVTYQVNYYTKKMLDEMGYPGFIISIDWGKRKMDGECILHSKKRGHPSTVDIEIRIFNPEDKEFDEYAFVFFLHEFVHSIFLVEQEINDHPTEREVWFHTMKVFIREGCERLISPIVFMDILHDCLSEYKETFSY